MIKTNIQSCVGLKSHTQLLNALVFVGVGNIAEWCWNGIEPGSIWIYFYARKHFYNAVICEESEFIHDMLFDSSVKISSVLCINWIL